MIHQVCITKPASKHEKARQLKQHCRALEVVLVQEPGSVQALNNTDQRFRVVALDKHGVRVFKRRGGLDTGDPLLRSFHSVL